MGSFFCHPHSAVKPSSEFLIQMLNFSVLEITFGSFYMVYISLIQCEYVLLYITEHSLTAILKSFSTDSIWVISQLDSVECFLGVFFSLLRLVYILFLWNYGSYPRHWECYGWKLWILVNASKSVFLFVHFSRQINLHGLKLQTFLQQQLKSHFSSFSLIGLFAIYSSNQGHESAREVDRASTKFGPPLSLCISVSLYLLFSLLTFQLLCLIPILQKDYWSFRYPLLHQLWIAFMLKATQMEKSPYEVPSFQVSRNFLLLLILKCPRVVDFFLSSFFCILSRSIVGLVFRRLLCHISRRTSIYNIFRFICYKNLSLVMEEVGISKIIHKMFSFGFLVGHRYCQVDIWQLLGRRCIDKTDKQHNHSQLVDLNSRGSDC